MVDVLALVSDEQLTGLGLEKNVWGLLDAEQAEQLYAAMPAGVEVSGGAAAHTPVGGAALGGSPQYIGKGSDDQLGGGFVDHFRSPGGGYHPSLPHDGAG